MDIVTSNTPIGEIIDEERFSLVMADIIEALHIWVMDTISGIDAELLTLFLIDFVQQVVATTFTVSPSDAPFDPSYV